MRIGSLFSGYGGLDMGVQAAIGGDVAWHVEFDPAPSKVLAHHYPDVPNYGDIRNVDWDAVEPVDVLTGGFPCQDVSLAGRRAGITAGSRSGLWSEFARAIDVLRPELVVIENVRGLLSATADGAVESDPWGVGDGATRPVVNAFGVVLGDLAGLGYDARWCGVRAADAGAPHGRFRVFCVAYPAGVGYGHGGASSVRGVPAPTVTGDLRKLADTAGESRRVWDGDDVRARGRTVRRAPDAGSSAVEDSDVAACGEWGVAASGETESGRARANTRGRDRTPAGHADITGLEGRPLRGERASERTPGADGVGTQWGPYEPAIRRWERTLRRVAPTPTTPDGRGGAHRLSPRFVEWMMGVPAGHVTNPAIGLTRNEQLKALGNGVVPQQAELAVRTLLAGVREELAA